jgi:hypothetical protein
MQPALKYPNIFAQTFSPKDLSLHGKHLRTSTCFLSMKGYLLNNSLVIFCSIITLNLNTLNAEALCGLVSNNLVLPRCWWEFFPCDGSD